MNVYDFYNQTILKQYKTCLMLVKYVCVKNISVSTNLKSMKQELRFDQVADSKFIAINLMFSWNMSEETISFLSCVMLQVFITLCIFNYKSCLQ